MSREAVGAATVAALLRNPLTGMSDQDVLNDADRFVEEKGLTEHREAFRKGALLAKVLNQDDGFERIDIVSEEEKVTLRREVSNRWHQPFMLYFLSALCAGSAIVQGMDQTAVNGAQVGAGYPHCRPPAPLKGVILSASAKLMLPRLCRNSTTKPLA